MKQFVLGYQDTLVVGFPTVGIDDNEKADTFAKKIAENRLTGPEPLRNIIGVYFLEII